MQPSQMLCSVSSALHVARDVCCTAIAALAIFLAIAIVVANSSTGDPFSPSFLLSPYAFRQTYEWLLSWLTQHSHRVPKTYCDSVSPCDRPGCNEMLLGRSATPEQLLLQASSLVYHFHMPKTGGTFLGKFLAHTYCLCPRGMSETFLGSMGKCECPFVDVHQARTRCSIRLEHCSLGNAYEHCRSIARGRTCRFVTTIREPLERTISQWRMCAHICETRPVWSLSLKRPVCDHFGMPCPPRGLKGNASLAAFAQLPWAQNPQAKMLAGEWGAEHCGTNDYFQPRAIDEANASLAAARLQAMWLVAPLAKLDALRECLRMQLGTGTLREERDAEADASVEWRYGHEVGGRGVSSSGVNSTRPLIRSSATVSVAPDVAVMILEHNKIDAALHDLAGRLFRERCEQVDPR